MTVSVRDLESGLRELRLGEAPVIVHSSLKSLGDVDGGAQAVVNALARAFTSVLVPTFTYRSMITPWVGPANNAMIYGSGESQNRMAEFFTPDMPADPLMGIIPETLRKHPRAGRSSHPILSLAGLNADRFLQAQGLDRPLGPLEALAKADGWVILLGVDHTVNTSIHAAEKLAGRRQFLRWALTPKGVVACPGFPGCSAGFLAIAPEVDKFTRRVYIGAARVQAVPLSMLFRAVLVQVRSDPLALLCSDADCERCGQIRDLLGKN